MWTSTSEKKNNKKKHKTDSKLTELNFRVPVAAAAADSSLRSLDSHGALASAETAHVINGGTKVKPWKENGGWVSLTAY